MKKIDYILSIYIDYIAVATEKCCTYRYCRFYYIIYKLLRAYSNIQILTEKAKEEIYKLTQYLFILKHQYYLEQHNFS